VVGTPNSTQLQGIHWALCVDGGVRNHLLQQCLSTSCIRWCKLHLLVINRILCVLFDVELLAQLLVGALTCSTSLLVCCRLRLLRHALLLCVPQGKAYMLGRHGAAAVSCFDPCVNCWFTTAPMRYGMYDFCAVSPPGGCCHNYLSAKP
jgi:hypothetical protein